ncbi:MAG: glutamine synthetase adenylyltransferase [Anaerolineales bacterium]|nr:glutamine synthetase adenylyltransferase [Anaerolineales bacterium]
MSDHLHNIAKRFGNSFGVVEPHLKTALASAADPERSLVYLERLLESADESLLHALVQNPRTIESLVTIFSGSQFLTEIILRNPKHVHLLYHRTALTKRKSPGMIHVEASKIISDTPDEHALDAIRRYQRGELLRIGASDLLDLYDFRTVTQQLSNLADGLVRACLDLASKQSGISANDFVVIAMGKHGAEELNYSSDIDLLFVSANDPIEKLKLGERLIENIGGVTSEGFLYRVDMRLRPWGRDGFLVTTLDGYLQYIQQNARLWEKQALLKARPIAGDITLGERLLAQTEPHIFSHEPEEVRASVFSMKQRTEQVLQQKGRDWGEVKLGEGSIRDVEFVVQYLQLAYGNHYHDLHGRATLQILPRLARHHLLTEEETRILADGYTFLRTIEHYIQVMHYQQTYTMPSEPEALSLLAGRLGFANTQALTHRYEEHRKAIRAIYLHRVGNEPVKETQPQVVQHIARLGADYVDSFSNEEIQHHADLARGVNEQTPAIVEAKPLGKDAWRVTVVGYDYLGELSIICGLFFVFGFNIVDGNAFTYEPLPEAPTSSRPRFNRFDESPRRLPPRRPASSSPETDTRRKIVDVFTVESNPFIHHDASIWDTYTSNLHHLLRMMRTGQRREARGELAVRVGQAYQNVSRKTSFLPPINIEIDNDADERYTILRIDAPDTFGFLYEFTNALALTHTYVTRMIVQSIGSRAQDILHVTNDNGAKITSPEKQRELRSAIVLIKHFTHLLPHSPNPSTALLHFREFLAELFKRPNWTDEIISIESPDVLNALARLLGVSNFLWEDFLRMQYANLFPVVTDMDALSSSKLRPQLESELTEALESNKVGDIEYPDWRATLNAFKDRELFRIDMRHILGLTKEFEDFSAELTDLAETTLCATLARCDLELRAVHGDPILEDGQPCGISLLALGKCGGRELGFASDIELMFVYAGNGKTNGTEIIDTATYFEKLVRSVLNAMQTRQEGIFQIDLQLRPYGKAGSMAVPFDSFRKYYAPDGAAWAYERQALVKMRPIMGDAELNAELCRLRDIYAYESGPFDVTAMRAMREKQVRHLVTGGTFNAKFSPGGLVDIEYLIQGLQIDHGSQNTALRLTNIRDAMSALHTAGILSDDDYSVLRKAHTFLRWLIDSLRVVRGNAKDVTVPLFGSEEFVFLARRLRYEMDVEHLRDDLTRYIADVQEINSRLLA